MPWTVHITTGHTAFVLKTFPPPLTRAHHKSNVIGLHVVGPPHCHPPRPRLSISAPRNTHHLLPPSPYPFCTLLPARPVSSSFLHAPSLPTPPPSLCISLDSCFLLRLLSSPLHLVLFSVCLRLSACPSFAALSSPSCSCIISMFLFTVIFSMPLVSLFLKLPLKNFRSKNC